MDKKSNRKEHLLLEYLNVLHDTAMSFLHCVELNDLLQVVLRRTCDLAGTEHGMIALYHSDEQDKVYDLKCVQALGDYDHLLSHIFPIQSTLAGQAFRTGKIQKQRHFGRHFGVVLVLPLHIGMKPLGVIELAMKDQEKTPTESDESLLKVTAHLAAIAIDNARLYESAEQELLARKKAEASLYQTEQTNQAILRAIPDLILRFRTDGTLLDLKVGSSFDLVIEPEELVGKHLSRIMDSDFTRKTAYYIERACLTGEPQVFEFQVLYCHQILFREMRMVPCGPSELLGIVRDITEQKKMQETLRKEMILASKVQHSFLPKPISSEVCLVRTIYEPFASVSGDVFDYYWLKDQEILFGFMLDVSGHGFATALQTSALLAVMRESSRRSGSLIDKLRFVNRKALHYFSEDSFAAIITFQFDFKKKILTYAAGGINQFYCATRQNKGRVLIPGSLVGITDSPEFEEVSTPFAAGDTFYFMTDGLSDLVEKYQFSSEAKNLMRSKFANFDRAYRALKVLSMKKERMDDASAVCIMIPVERYLAEYSFVNFHEVKVLRTDLNAMLEKLKVRYSLFEVAVHEALNNALKYRNEKYQDQPVTLKLKQIGNRLIVRIKYPGYGFEGNKKLNQIRAVEENPFESALLDERGRGVMIMMSACDYILYNRAGNEVLMMKKIVP